MYCLTAHYPRPTAWRTGTPVIFVETVQEYDTTLQSIYNKTVPGDIAKMSTVNCLSGS